MQKLEPLKAAGDPRVRQMIGVALYHADEYQPRGGAAPRRSRRACPPIRSSGARRTQVLGFALHLLGRHAEAHSLAGEDRAHTPDQLELNFILGQAYAHANQPGPAREAFARSFGLDARFRRGARGRGETDDPPADGADGGERCCGRRSTIGAC